MTMISSPFARECEQGEGNHILNGGPVILSTHTLTLSPV